MHSLREIVANAVNIFSVVGTYLGRDALSLCLYAVAGIVVLGLCLSRVPLWRKLLALCGLAAALLLATGPLLALKSTMSAARTLIPLCMFVYLLFVLACANSGAVLRRLTAAVAVAAMLFSASILTSIGNAYRDQGEFENNILIQPLLADFSRIYAARGKFSFAVYGTVPEHCTLRELERHYGYVGSPSVSLFVAMRLLSWLNVTYDLKLSYDLMARPFEQKEYTLVSRQLAYDLYRKDDKTYIVVLKSDFSPTSVQRFS